MKKIVSLLLALVLILALAGCRTSTRSYRRYAAPNSTKTYDTYDGVYRSNNRARTINPGDAPLYDGSFSKSITRRPATGNTVDPSTVVPVPTTTPMTGRSARPFNVPS